MKSGQPVYTSSTSSVTDENSDIKKLVIDFFNIWPIVLILIVVNILLAYFINKTTTPAYPVQATMVIKQDKNPASKELFESIGLKTSDNIENEISILNSFTLAYNTLKELDFNIEYFKDDFWRQTEVYNKLRYKIEVDWSHQQLLNGEFSVEVIDGQYFEVSLKDPGLKVFRPETPDGLFHVTELPSLDGKYKLNEWIEGKHFKFRLVKADDGTDKTSKFSFRLRSNYLLAVQYSKMLKVAPEKKESTILSLSLDVTLVDKGMKYLNKIIDVYQARELLNKNRTATNTAAFINSQLKGIQDSLSFFEDQLQRYRSSKQSYNLQEQSSLVLTRLATLEDERAKIALKIKYYESVRNYLAKEEIDRLIVPSAVGIEESGIDQLINELVTIQNDRLRLNQYLSGDNRTLKDLNFRYTSVLNTLKESINRSYQSARLSLSDVNTRIARMNAELNVLPGVERNLLSIQRQFSISENIYTYLLQKRNEAEISKASNIPSSEVLDLARPVGGMITPKPARNYAVALSLALILPLLFLFIRNSFNNKIHDSKLLEKRLKVPLLGIIGKSRRKISNNIVFDLPKSYVSENFRSIRASTQFLHPGNTSMVIAFTSSISGEGKTFCSVNTAAIYALGGKKTILVGLDLRRPKIAEDFNLKNDIGISNYLSGANNLHDMIKKSRQENMDILLSGPIPPNPAELIGSHRFVELMSTLRASYDVIILDCPPAGLVSETIDIFNQSDMSFYIFRHLFSDWDAVTNLNDMIDKGLIKKAYAIYNDMAISSDYSYGYGYHYGMEEVKNPRWKKIGKKFKKIFIRRDFREDV